MKINKILVIQKKYVGDVLASTVLFEALREKFPKHELHYLIYENSEAVVYNNPFIDKIIILNKKNRDSLIGFTLFLLKIKKEKYHIIVDAYGKPNSVIIGWFSGAKKTISYYKSYTKLLYTDTVKRNEKSISTATKAIEHRLLLLTTLNIPFKIIKPKIYITDVETRFMKNKLEKAGLVLSKPIVMISALGSHENKTYPLDFLAKIIDTIAQKTSAQILFNYFPNQIEEAKKLYFLCEPETQSKIFFDFYEKDLRAFMTLTSLCSALVGNEGGATNIAKALEVPTFTIFSPLIKKNDWNMFEDRKQNVSVHVKDFEKSLQLQNIDGQILNKEYQNLYAVFLPKLFKDQFDRFINLNISKDENRI